MIKFDEDFQISRGDLVEVILGGIVLYVLAVAVLLYF